MKLKKKLIIIILLLTTIILSIINLKNTSRTYLYFLNFKSEKLTLGNFITLSFFTGLTTTLTFNYLISQKDKKNVFNSEKSNFNSDISDGDFKDNYYEREDSIDERPPERDIRDSQPTISVNYRVIKQNNIEVNDIDEDFTNNGYQNNGDWGEIESNW